MGDGVRDVDANLRWYGRHQVTAGALFWMPAIVLYFVDSVGLAGALRLQAVYYLAVVVFEVPSGWWSDRVGRVATLRLAAAAWAGAHLLFLVGSSLWVLVAGQVLLALGYAGLSGTDTTFHLDTLEAAGRADEFDRHEATIRRRMLVTTAASALAGGALGAFDFRFVFAASLGAAVVQLGSTVRLTEPDRVETTAGAGPTGVRETARGTATPETTRGVEGARASGTGGATRVGGATVRFFRVPAIGWLAACIVAQVTVVHLAADLTPPYLAELSGPTASAVNAGVLPAGILAAAVAAAGATVVGFVPRLADTIGVPATLVMTGSVPVAILAAMSAVDAWWLVPALAFRGTQAVTVSVLAPRVVASHVGARHRATLLSLMSLGGRLAYGATLLVLGATTVTTSGALRLSAAIVFGVWLMVAVAQRAVPRDQRALVHEHHHTHPAQFHEHPHRHDDGHHDHHHDHHHDVDLASGPVVHSHPHHHDATEHAHPHTSDVHHGHGHRHDGGRG